MSVHEFGLPTILRQRYDDHGGEQAVDEPVLNWNDEMAPNRPEHDTTGHARLRKSIQDTLARQSGAQSVAQESVAYGTAAQPLENPFTLSHVDSAGVWFEELIRAMDPDIDPKLYMREDVIMEWAPGAIPFRFKLSTGLGGGHVKAITLGNWTNHFTRYIFKYARSRDGRPIGGTLLIQRGLLRKLRAVTSNLIKDNDLSRTIGKDRLKLTWGLEHYALIWNQLIGGSADSIGDTRVIKLETSGSMLMSIHALFRSGSMGPSCKQYENSNMFPKLGDVTFHIPQPGGIAHATMEFNRRFTKYHNTTDIAPEQAVFFDPPNKWHNGIFHTALVFIASFYGRGAFGNMTLDELLNFKGAVLRAVESARNEPLFAKSELRGTALERDDQGRVLPASAANISHRVSDAAVSAGLPRGSLTCFRRGSSNFYALARGTEFTKCVLGHVATSNNTPGGVTFERNYDNNVANFNLVGVRCGDIPLSPERAQLVEHARRRNLLINSVVDVLVNRTALEELGDEPDTVLEDDQDTGNDVDRPAPSGQPGEASTPRVKNENIFLSKNHLTNARRENVLTDPKVVETEAQMIKAWDDYLALFPAHAKGYYKFGTKGDTQSIGLYKTRFRPRSGVTPEEFYAAESELRNAIQYYLSIRQYVCRRESKAQQADEAAEDQRAERTQNTGERRAEVSENELPVLAHNQVLKMIQIDDDGVALPPSMQHVSPPDWFTASEQELDAYQHHLEWRRDAMARDYDESHEKAIAYDRTALDELNFLERESERHHGNDVPLDINVVPYGIRLANEYANFDADDSMVEFEDEPVTESELPFLPTLDGPATASGAPLRNDSRATSGPQTQRVCIDTAQDPDYIGGLSTTEVFRRLFLELVRPIEQTKRLQMQYQLDGERWLCPSCASLYPQDLDRVERDWNSRRQLERHMREQHTQWSNFEVDMMTDKHNVWNCPSGDYTGKTMFACRRHMRSTCKDADFYNAVYMDHRRATYNLKDRIRYVPVLEDRPEDYVADETPSQAHEIREQVLDMRDWDMNKLSEGFTKLGLISEGDEGSEDRTALQELRDIAADLYTDPHFYDLPIDKYITDKDEIMAELDELLSE